MVGHDSSKNRLSNTAALYRIRSINNGGRRPRTCVALYNLERLGRLGPSRNDARNHLSELLGGEGFGEGRHRGPAICRLNAPGRSVRGHEQHTGREVRPTLLNVAIQCLTVHPRHPKIAQDHIVTSCSEPLEGFVTVCYCVHMVAVATQLKGNHLPRVCLVLHD